MKLLIGLLAVSLYAQAPIPGALNGTGGGGGGGGATAPATLNLYGGNNSVNGIVAKTPGTDYVAGSYPVTWAPLGSGSGQGLYDFFSTSFTDAVSGSGAGSAQYSGPGQWIGRNKNSSLSANQMFYSERLMDQGALGGSSPWLFNANTANIFTKLTFPGTSAMVANTTVQTVGGSSAGNHVPQNALLAGCYGFGDTCGEFDAYGGMVNGVYILTLPDPQTSTVFPQFALNINASGSALNDSIPFNIYTSGVPQSGQLMGVSSLGALQKQLFLLRGPLDGPGGTLTANGAFADILAFGNINDVGGHSITLDAGTGSSNSVLTLTARNAGVAKTAQFFADQNGAANITTSAGNAAIFAGPAGLSVDPGSGSFNAFINLTARNGGTAKLGQFLVDQNGQVTINAASGQNVTIGGPLVSPVYKTSTNCSSLASPAVCGSAAAGSVAIPTGITSVALTVNSSAITANSQIFLQSDDSLGTKLSVTCNSTLATLVGGMAITNRVAGTSFEITYNGTIATNPLCVSYHILN